MSELDRIWDGDRLSRRNEAKIIQNYLVAETATFRSLGRQESIVLGIDAPYGRGKTWFLERLANQIELSHPVARVNAWTDDAGDEPLTAFMAAIDQALTPYLSESKKLTDRLAQAKAAALPVIGKLAAGAAIKALSKIAGEGIEQEVGTAVEDAMNLVKTQPGKDGAAAEAMEAALDKLGKEIDSLVDRRGAAMLAAYRQRKKSREIFRLNMSGLVAGIDGSKGPGTAPLFVVVDELDRCRPDYALRMLEEIKHFFDVPGVVFILGLHGGQLSKSIKAVYGTEFDSDDYLRRFFTRRYELRSQSIVELVASLFEELGLDENKLKFPNAIIEDGYPLTNARIAGLTLAQWNVTPREITSILDGLRLFIDGWEHPEPIEPILLLGLLVHLVRGEPLGTGTIAPATDQLRFRGYSDRGGHTSNSAFTPNQYLTALSPLAWTNFQELRQQSRGDAPRNYILDWLGNELNDRTGRGEQPLNQSYLVEYIGRVYDISRFVDPPLPEEGA